MLTVKIADSKLREITTVEMSRVPCVGEKILIVDCEGNGAPHTVEYVDWTLYRNNSKPIEAMISVELDLGTDEEYKAFIEWFNSGED